MTTIKTRRLILALEDNENKKAILGKNHYSVYIVELSKDVMKEHKFKLKNPNYDPSKKCLYVGMTGLDPKERFQKHKNGIKHNVYVERHGLHLLPNLYSKYTEMSFEDAKAKEMELADELRSKGNAVWSA
jgi:predicted GIY-YIG superfamily endonuclease